MDLKEIGVETGNWVDSDQDYWRALVNAALNLRICLGIYNMSKNILNLKFFSNFFIKLSPITRA